MAGEGGRRYPVMRCYPPAAARWWCEKQIMRTATLPGLRFSVPWLVRHARDDELRQLLAAAALARSAVARLAGHAGGRAVRFSAGITASAGSAHSADVTAVRAIRQAAAGSAGRGRLAGQQQSQIHHSYNVSWLL